MKLTRGLTEATSAVTAASSSLSDITPDVKEAVRDVKDAAMWGTVAFIAVSAVAIVALLFATAALDEVRMMRP